MRTALPVLILLTLLAPVVAACGFVGPIEFVGEVTLRDLETGAEDRHEWENPSFGSSCEASGWVDINEEIATWSDYPNLKMLDRSSGDVMDLGERPNKHVIDGEFIYTAGSAFERIHWSSGAEEDLSNSIGTLQVHDIDAFAVMDGIMVVHTRHNEAGSENDSRNLTVVDLASSEVLWSVNDLDGENDTILPGLADLFGIIDGYIVLGSPLTLFDYRNNTSFQLVVDETQRQYHWSAQVDDKHILISGRNSTYLHEVATNVTSQIGDNWRLGPGPAYWNGSAIWLSYDTYRPLHLVVLQYALLFGGPVLLILLFVAVGLLVRRRTKNRQPRPGPTGKDKSVWEDDWATAPRLPGSGVE